MVVNDQVTIDFSQLRLMTDYKLATGRSFGGLLFGVILSYMLFRLDCCFCKDAVQDRQ